MIFPQEFYWDLAATGSVGLAFKEIGRRADAVQEEGSKKGRVRVVKAIIRTRNREEALKLRSAIREANVGYVRKWELWGRYVLVWLRMRVAEARVSVQLRWQLITMSVEELRRKRIRDRLRKTRQM